MKIGSNEYEITSPFKNPIKKKNKNNSFLNSTASLARDVGGVGVTSTGALAGTVVGGVGGTVAAAKLANRFLPKENTSTIKLPKILNRIGGKKIENLVAQNARKAKVLGVGALALLPGAITGGVVGGKTSDRVYRKITNYNNMHLINEFAINDYELTNPIQMKKNAIRRKRGKRMDLPQLWYEA